jgi:hypothetical protein
LIIDNNEKEVKVLLLLGICVKFFVKEVKDNFIYKIKSESGARR